MDKKIIYGIIIIVILLFAGITAFKIFSSSGNQVEVEDATFTLPEGYKVIGNNKSTVEISNGYDSIKIVGYKNEKIDKLVKNYASKQKKRNNTLSMSDFKVDNINVKKAVLDSNNYIVHYWFEYKNKAYSIYTSDANRNTDDIVKDLVKSLE